MSLIYLDSNASTPVAPEVLAAMQPYLEDHFGNPSSQHWASSGAKDALEAARGQVANLLDCDPTEVVFTSGGSEANNHAIKGVYFALRYQGNHIITSAVEHPAVLEPCRFLESLGARITRLPVDGYGMVDPEQVRRAIDKDTILISIMHANNETGTIQPIEAIGEIARAAGILFHTDAAQSVGKIPTVMDALGVDLLSVAGHKLSAPKGVGALYIREGTPIVPLVHGAAHEAGRRAGTENVLLNVALGAACELAGEWTGAAEMIAMRDEFWQHLQNQFGNRISLNGHPTERLPNTLNVNFHGAIGAEILEQMPEVAASTGSACHAGAISLSPVLEAMGVPVSAGMGAVRFSLGRNTKYAELQRVLELLTQVVNTHNPT
ncbi:aminotransferase class V [Desulfurispirillum indicum S5]|uniref:cysteine desulfurase n=1 Tax=Desulfurispirillum indicum (strain ATCC BAA-1389 / DSM 22839 / S5) TaxID=653733 RepID=E6W700_DESIS|nr:cysteine desulfurase family protein [Desulfurispirillum indicum]ADU65078.1 aminotransferase class V [Desulfurispirillum indicum S5]